MWTIVVICASTGLIVIVLETAAAIIWPAQPRAGRWRSPAAGCVRHGEPPPAHLADVDEPAPAYLLAIDEIGVARQVPIACGPVAAQPVYRGRHHGDTVEIVPQAHRPPSGSRLANRRFAEFVARRSGVRW